MDEATAVATVKRRGRPVGSVKPPVSSPVDPYLSFLSAHPAHEEAKGFSLQLFLKRFDVQTANIFEQKPLAQRFAEAAGTSLHVATRVVAGLTPLTSNMVVAIAKNIGCTTDELLMGREQKAQSTKPLAEDEMALLAHFKSADQVGKSSLLFLLALDRWLESLPDEARDRVISSLIGLHESGAQELLAPLPSLLGAFQAKTGIDPLGCIGAETIFTPIHEFCGVYGPETKPLLGYDIK